MFTSAQQGQYRPLVSAAWKEHCRVSGMSENADGAYETWYRDALRESIGATSTRHANQTTDFDLAMLHFAIIADNTYWIERAHDAAERRMRFVISQKMKHLAELEHKLVTWDYIVGILDQMHLPTRMEDCPVQLLAKAMMALDTHIRRLEKRSHRATA